MPFNALDGYIFKVVARLGLSSDIPTMVVPLTQGELAWTTDNKILHIGNDTETPARVMSEKSTESFDFADVPSVKFNEILMYDGGTVDGVDISTLTAGTGLLVHGGSGVFYNRNIYSPNSSIVVTNASGVAGNIGLAINPTALSYFLTGVTTSTSFGGAGTTASPLTLSQADISLIGGVVRATQAEVSSSTQPSKYVTPGTLRTAIQDQSLPLLLQATQGQIGVSRFATAAETTGASSPTLAISPVTLAYGIAAQVDDYFATHYFILSTQTIAKPSWANRALIVLTAGGGGGGGCQSSSTSNTFAGAGGGGGATIIGVVDVAASTVNIVIGAGGAGSTGANPGAPGGASSFGTITVNGGGGGSRQNAQSTPGGGGGTPVNTPSGCIGLNGGVGSDGQSQTWFICGNGGSSFWGSGGRSGSQGGVNALVPGTGGGGAYDASLTGSAYTGGNGAGGACEVWWMP